MDERMSESAAKVIAQHRKLWSDTVASCSGCDWSHFGNITRTDLAHASHVLDALREAGWELVKLPQPDQDDEDGIGWGYEPLTDWGVFVSRDIVDGRVYDQNGGVKPADARLIASWWLAAAAAVSQDGEK